MDSRLIRISDPEDPRIYTYRNIKERDLVGREQRFVAEGKVVLDVLLSSGRFQAESVLLRENRVAGMAPLLARLPDNVPVYVAEGAVMDTIAGFPMHRGVLAIGLRGPEERLEALLARMPEEALVVALCGISDHDNMGAIFRNAAAFGADAVLMDASSCDPLYRKAIRVSVGGALEVPFVREGSADALVDILQEKGFRVLALSPSGKDDIKSVKRAPRTALLLGAEGPGLPQRLIKRLPSVRIPIRSDFDSLNVAAATAIALHELWR
ncbi:RNA methyltransferase [Chelativorans sp. Marseille-P2723]|uniref:TrmH family RNA methyltransferase n=1 Tax=Chelativorans sp. Marseille-P2723 TaxID=2709133 RepID=UPI00156F9698|nr:RNA methyltransferase [Chelativorans sp. Marseille-P2723]